MTKTPATKSVTVMTCVECGTNHPQVGGAVHGVRGVEQPRRGDGRRRPDSRPPRRPRLGAARAQPAPRHRRDARPAAPTGIAELDRVLGGGIVPGSVTLLGGEPGIGKSTLLLQLLGLVAGADALRQRRGEPAAGAPARRAARCRAPRAVDRRRRPRSKAILAAIDQHRPEPRGGRQHPDDRRRAARVGARLGRPGARLRPAARRRGQAAQRRDRARRPRHQGRLARRPPRARARRRHRALVRGRASPRAADAPRRQAPLRLHQRARAVRDDRPRPRRRARPLQAVPRPTAAAGSPARSSSRSSRATARCSSRSRRSPSASRPARRPGATPRASTAAGWRCSSPCSNVTPWLRLGGQDVYVSAVGGMRLTEPGTDLGVAIAVASAATDLPVPDDLVVIGEVGLGGEVRQVVHAAAPAHRGGPARLSPGDRAGVVARVDGIRAARASPPWPRRCGRHGPVGDAADRGPVERPANR